VSRIDAAQEDAVVAGVDLVGRSGASDVEIGYLDDDVPSEQAHWYAQASYQGARIAAENLRGPVEAVEALARRILTGAKCAHCDGVVSLSDEGAVIFEDQPLVDGTRWTRESALAASQCRWVREGRRWKRGCEDEG
jgi:hypothetical protein